MDNSHAYGYHRPDLKQIQYRSGGKCRKVVAEAVLLKTPKLRLVTVIYKIHIIMHLFSGKPKDKSSCNYHQGIQRKLYPPDGIICHVGKSGVISDAHTYDSHSHGTQYIYRSGCKNSSRKNVDIFRHIHDYYTLAFPPRAPGKSHDRHVPGESSDMLFMYTIYHIILIMYSFFSFPYYKGLKKYPKESIIKNDRSEK